MEFWRLSWKPSTPSRRIKKLGTVFERTVNEYLLEIECLRLEWCKTKPMPKKQWLAENELGLARIVPFVYLVFFNSVDWSKKTNHNPLHIPAMVQMIHTMHVMICLLMSPRDPLEAEINNHVKLFLSCCHRFSKLYWASRVELFWARTGNFPTLLCLPKQQRRHSPMQWYWEGTSERFIQVLKRN